MEMHRKGRKRRSRGNLKGSGPENLGPKLEEGSASAPSVQIRVHPRLILPRMHAIAIKCTTMHRQNRR